MYLKSAEPTSSITGRTTVITVTTTRGRRVIYPMTSSATRIWMTMAIGATIRITVTSGTPAMLKQAGRRITKATGTGFLPGDIRGSMTLRGATRHSITDAG